MISEAQPQGDAKRRTAPGGERRIGAMDTSPSLQLRGIDRILVLCQLTSQTIVRGGGIDSDTLCRRVRAIAQRGAPMPVDVIALADPALQSPRAAVLFVQASVAELAPQRPGLIFTARLERNAAWEENRTYFGATPRVAPFTSAAGGAAWDGAITASLSEVLPWLRPADAGDLLPGN
jgi:hypothetical protein